MWLKRLLPVLVLLSICSVSVGAKHIEKNALCNTPEKKQEGYHGPGLAGVVMGGYILSPDEHGDYRLPGKVVGAKCGFIDPSGKYIFAPKFEDVAEFSEGLAGVMIKDHWGFVDRNGKVLIPPTFDQVSEFHEGLCPVKIDGWWHYIDRTGNYAMKAQFAGLANGIFKDGMAEVQLESFGKQTRIDRKGNVLPELTAFPSAEGFVRFKRDGKFGFRDEAGHEVIAPIYTYADDFSEGLAAVYIPDKRVGFGYIDRTGKFVIPARYAQCGRFQNGLARVGFDGGYSFLIDKSGQKLPGFGNVLDEEFSEGFVRTLNHDKYGFVDRSGKLLGDKLFDEAMPFINGYATVKVGTKYGVIDKSGKFVVEPKFDWTGLFQEGVLPVRIGGVYKPGPAIGHSGP